MHVSTHGIFRITVCMSLLAGNVDINIFLFIGQFYTRVSSKLTSRQKQMNRKKIFTQYNIPVILVDNVFTNI